MATLAVGAAALARFEEVDCGDEIRTLARHIVQDLCFGSRQFISELYAHQGLPCPEVDLEPDELDLPDEKLRFLLQYWNKLRGNRALPSASDVDAVEMRPSLGSIALLEVLEDGQDFRYRVYGTDIAERTRFDLTRKRVMEISRHVGMPTPFIAYYMALYQTATKLRRPVFSTHRIYQPISAFPWRHLTLPLSDGNEDGPVTRLLVGNTIAEPAF
ncbi:MAG: PAS domain-containing protein [Alphaproteobacteria bacterium]|nr:PAS domain-containing protein [Alphaproteobacteria bacterium]